MTIEKAVKLGLQIVLFGMAYTLAMIPIWQFVCVAGIIILADRIGQSE